MYICQFSGSNFIILLLYVDDMLIVGQDAILISKLKDELSKSFDMRIRVWQGKFWVWTLPKIEKKETVLITRKIC